MKRILIILQLASAIAATTAYAAPASAAPVDGTCPGALAITRIGEPSNRIEMVQAIRQRCHTGDKITLPKSETYVVSTACDLNKQVVDLGPYVVCLLGK